MMLTSSELELVGQKTAAQDLEYIQENQVHWFQ